MNETIFDYNVNDDEKVYLHVKEKHKVSYFRRTSDKRKLYDLYVLFRMRNDDAKAQIIWQSIVNKSESLLAA
jgi:hypothetical protein